MANKPQANHGDIAEYRHQGKAIWSNGVRLSEHEHVEAHINLVKQTTNR